MERYIICKRFEGKTISGHRNLIKGTVLYAKCGYLCINDHPIFTERSQNAYDHASLDEDGKGTIRFNIRNAIIEGVKAMKEEYGRAVTLALEGIDREDAEAVENAISSVDDKPSRFFAQVDPKFMNGGVFGYGFHTASIQELQTLKDALDNI